MVALSNPGWNQNFSKGTIFADQAPDEFTEMVRVTGSQRIRMDYLGTTPVTRAWFYITGGSQEARFQESVDLSSFRLFNNAPPPENCIVTPSLDPTSSYYNNFSVTILGVPKNIDITLQMSPVENLPTRLFVATPDRDGDIAVVIEWDVCEPFRYLPYYSGRFTIPYVQWSTTLVARDLRFGQTGNFVRYVGKQIIRVRNNRNFPNYEYGEFYVDYGRRPDGNGYLSMVSPIATPVAEASIGTLVCITQNPTGMKEFARTFRITLSQGNDYDLTFYPDNNVPKLPTITLGPSATTNGNVVVDVLVPRFEGS
jgi:hypothetical protein